MYRDDVFRCQAAQTTTLGDEAFSNLGVQAVMFVMHFDHYGIFQQVIGGTVDSGIGSNPLILTQLVAPDDFPPTPVSLRSAATMARPTAIGAATVPSGRSTCSAITS